MSKMSRANYLRWLDSEIALSGELTWLQAQQAILNYRGALVVIGDTYNNRLCFRGPEWLLSTNIRSSIVRNYEHARKWAIARGNIANESGLDDISSEEWRWIYPDELADIESSDTEQEDDGVKQLSLCLTDQG